jgi:TolB-like protein
LPAIAAQTATTGRKTKPETKLAARKPTLAILYFEYGGRNPDLAPLSTGLAEMLISDLAGTESVTIVERQRLQAVLDEQKLSAGGKVDPRTAVRLGRLLGARYLVLGSYFDMGKNLRADARLVDVETSRIVTAFGANGVADDFMAIETQLATRIATALTTVLPQQSAATEVPRRPARSVPRVKTGTAATYGKALIAMDAGNAKQAKALLTTVVEEAPGFTLATRDLDRLLQ